MSLAHRGRKHSDETKKRLSDLFSDTGNNFYGRHHSEESRKSIGIAQIGENNINWKDREAGYSAIHYWVERNKEESDVCNSCDKPKTLYLANISGEYRRDVDDYWWLCASCHRIYDQINGFGYRLKKFKR